MSKDELLIEIRSILLSEKLAMRPKIERIERLVLQELSGPKKTEAAETSTPPTPEVKRRGRPKRITL